MKKITTLLLLFFCISVFSQRKIDKMTYAQSQDINFFRKIKNRTLVNEYVTQNDNSVKIGDTLIIGKPTSSENLTKSATVAAGSRNIGGALTNSRSTTKKVFEFIQLGRPAGFGSVMSALNGDSPDMAGISISGERVIIKELKTYHKGSKKKPLYVVMVLGEINGRAFGINKYLSVMNTELAIELGEVHLKNRKMTREEAIFKLKEAKDLLDLEMMSQKEYDELKEKLKPIIIKKRG